MVLLMNIKKVEGDPNLVPPLNKILQLVNWCLLQKYLLSAITHFFPLPSSPGCYGNLGTRASPRKRWGVFLHADGGPSLVPSPPQVKSVFKGFPSVVTNAF